ncbi:hypothetical protein BU23DRAFT_595450 [Bimuria novae-zelandiae CBS 107.79]|uniref:dihydroneopterin aldolase n=1 Tax=Bimuria novae-zelandiae CBS 107.79 TaxID=1447943 RepID=A0A6A5VPT0_9PLEO|nr:hypothetical protein BU23DRAFT_595450 [Bimuria novae-zelandiae CBS 107.79]
MPSTLTQYAWQAHPTQLAVTDKIIVRNLQATVDAGVDVWGREKKQRALLTVTLSLLTPFDSAADADALDNSTVHYGKLSKDIQAHVSTETRYESTFKLAESIKRCVLKTAGATNLKSIEVDVFYPKGSMLGEGAGFAYGRSAPGHLDEEAAGYLQMYLRNIRIPCLIGINANERLQKQPVVVNVWVDRINPIRSDQYPILEQQIVDVISSSSFETLESLSTTVIRHLREKFFVEQSDKEWNTSIRLRIEKPHAVPAADAPAIEIVRSV